MATNKRTATPKPSQYKKLVPKKTPIAMTTEAKKTPIGKKKGAAAAAHAEEHIQREMQEQLMKEHEKKQRKRLLAEDNKSTVSKLAEGNEDVEMESFEVQLADAGEARFAEGVDRTTEGGEVQAVEREVIEMEDGEVQSTKEIKHVIDERDLQAMDVGEVAARDSHETAAQAEGNELQTGRLVTGEGAVRDEVLINMPKVPVAQMFGVVGSIEKSPFVGQAEQEQTGGVPSILETATKKAQEDFEKMREEEDFTDFSKVSQQEVAGPDSKDQYLGNIFTLNTDIDYRSNKVHPSSVQLQRSPSARPPIPQSPANFLDRRPVHLKVAQLRGGRAVASGDPFFRYKPTQFPPASQVSQSPSMSEGRQTSAETDSTVGTPTFGNPVPRHKPTRLPPAVQVPQSPPVTEGRQTPAETHSMLGTPTFDERAHLSVAPDPMAPPTNVAPFIGVGLKQYFQAKGISIIKPTTVFNKHFIDETTSTLCQHYLHREPELWNEISTITAQWPSMKLRVLAKINLLPTWWFLREQIVMSFRKWTVEDDWTDQQVKDAVEFLQLSQICAHIVEPEWDKALTSKDADESHSDG